MSNAKNISAATIQVRVSDFDVGNRWYEQLLGRPADFVPHAGFSEWELVPDFWIQVAEGTPTPGSGPLRLGVDDIDAERQRVQRELGVEASPIGRLEGVAAWCNFEDPFGNRLGLFQDLVRHPA